MPKVPRIAMAVALFATLAGAQETLEVEGPQPGVVRLGDRAEVVLRIEGRGADPRPPKFPDVAGLRIEVSPPTRSSQTFYDGRSLVERSGVYYRVALQPLHEGQFVVPAFPLWTGTREQQVRELRLEARKDLRGEELGWIDVHLESTRVYVHEPIRLRVEFGIQQGLRLVEDVHQGRYRYLDVEVLAPWLAEFPAGEGIELPAPTGDTRLIVGNRMLFQAAHEADHEREGKRWQRFVFERAFLPTRLGTVELPAPLLRYHVLLREGQRDIFGGSRGRQSDNYYAYGKPISIEVLPIPEAGRPSPFYGAVGRFQLAAALDKDTVKVGGSVKLTLTVTGQGNFEFLRLPPLDELPGFHKLGEAQAKRDADKVVVTYDLAPLSAEVRQVPPIRWNYFDTTPGVESFVEVATTALPLVVRPLENGETLAPMADSERKAVTPGVDDVFDLPDLTGAPKVRSGPPAWWGWAAVLGPWLAVLLGAVAFRVHRRRAADVAGQRARGAARVCGKALRDGVDPVDALAAYLGDRLAVPAAAIISPDLRQRLAAAGIDAELAAATAAAVDRGTAARYGGGAPLAAAEVEDLVRRLEPVRIVRAPGAVAVLLAAAFAAGLPAQAATGVDEAVAAYRRGDYAVAEQGFAQAFATTGDWRLWQARGNCFFRLGDLPRARWAYEAARSADPRNPELLANLALVRTRLELPPEGEGFGAELQALRERFTRGERCLVAAVLMLGAASFLLLGWRRLGARWLGVLLLLPGAWLAIDLLWHEAHRPPGCIALEAVEVVAEPRTGLAPVATVRPGVCLPLLGGDQGAFVRVQAGERAGFVPRDRVAVLP